MGVLVALIAVAMRRMDRHIGRDPEARHLLSRDACTQSAALAGIKFGRQRQLPLPLPDGDAVGPGLKRLSRVPERGPIARPGGSIVGGKDEGILDPGLAGVVMDAALALAGDDAAGAIGGGGRWPSAALP